MGRSFTYDTLGRRTFVGFGTLPGPTYESTISYAYDAGNRLTNIVDSISGAISRSYDGLVKGHRAIHKLGLSELSKLVKGYCVKPPVPTIAELSWPKADNDHWSLQLGQDFHKLSHSHGGEKQICELIED